MRISKKRTVLVTTLILLFSIMGFGQIVENQSLSNLCGTPEENCMGYECERGEPVIFGKPYFVPKLRIQLLNENTNQPFVATKVTLNYIWKWLEYPYTEHPFGAWEEESYSTSCQTNENGFVEVVEFKVEPHGWYKGRYSFGKKPRFLNISVGYELVKCYTYEEITRKELDKCKAKGKCEFTIKDACPLSWK